MRLAAAVTLVVIVFSAPSSVEAACAAKEKLDKYALGYAACFSLANNLTDTNKTMGHCFCADRFRVRPDDNGDTPPCFRYEDRSFSP